MVPPVLDPTSDDYRLLTLHVAVHLPKDGIVPLWRSSGVSRGRGRKSGGVICERAARNAAR